MDIHGAGLAQKVVSPGQAEKLLAAEHQAAMLPQDMQHLEFLGAQIQELPIKLDFPARRVNLQIAHMECCGVCCSLNGHPDISPQDRFDPRHQLARVEGLGQVIVRPQLKAKDLINILIPGCHHQNRDGISGGPEVFAHLEASQAREHHIQDHQVRMQPLDVGTMIDEVTARARGLGDRKIVRSAHCGMWVEGDPDLLERLKPKAKRVIFIVMAGGPSHLELYDNKPTLAKMHGQPMPESITRGQPIAQLVGAHSETVDFVPQFRSQRPVRVTHAHSSHPTIV